MSLFLQVLGMVFFAELGDKTQFLMIAMASKYKIRTILVGVFASICALNALAIGVGALLGGFLPVTLISLAAGGAFLCFAYMAVGEDGDEKISEGAGKGSFFSVFGTFFLAELGDKTQLTALTLAADSSTDGFSLTRAAAVFAGATLALFAADILGLLVGFFLGKALPASTFSWISFGIFSVFGVLKLLRGFEEIFSGVGAAIALTALISVIFAALVIRKTGRGRTEKYKIKDGGYGNEKNDSAKFKPL
ncbi:MAG: TMEM165/GDT1 family protein [Clostridia bacterium]|nr:TMEM165/GDT1 family protein [Clostridia bacterium]